MLLEQSDKDLEQVSFHCLLVLRYPLFVNAETFNVFHVSQNIDDRDSCLKTCYLLQFASNLAI